MSTLTPCNTVHCGSGHCVVCAGSSEMVVCISLDVALCRQTLAILLKVGGGWSYSKHEMIVECEP